jgi:hypothetical protein
MIRIAGCFALLLTALVVTGCGSRDPRFRDDTLYLGGFRPRVEQRRAPHDDVSYWDGDGVGGSPSIKISLGEQRAYFYKSGQLVGVSVLSTGREGFGTPTGSFKITQKDRDHKSNLYGDYVDASTGQVVQKDIDRKKDPMPRGCTFDGARMPFFMRIHGGVGMHEGFLPGYPASHGCIRMPALILCRGDFRPRSASTARLRKSSAFDRRAGRRRTGLRPHRQSRASSALPMAGDRQ